jgi:hypothetical protein
MAHSPHGSRIVYPSLPETLTEDDLARFYGHLGRMGMGPLCSAIIRRGCLSVNHETHERPM